MITTKRGFFLILALMFGTILLAQNGDKNPKAEEGKQAEKSVLQSGYVVRINPDRSIESAPQLSAEMQEALTRLISTSSEGLKTQDLGNGTVLVNLQGRFRSATVATIKPDGKIQTQCISKPPQIAKTESKKKED